MKWIKLIPSVIRNKIIESVRETDDVLPPKDFFAKIKDKSQRVTPEMLSDLRRCLSSEIEMFIENGQLHSAERMLFHLQCIDREQKVIDAGLTKFVYRDDLDDFITKVSRQVVKIIELESYERKIPKDKSKQIQKVKDLFDQVYIVFTDYTGRESKKVEKKKRAQDPIAFGTFKTQDNLVWNHRFYFICDWEDEYCDLTLDKYVSQMIEAGYDTPVHESNVIDVHELEQRITDARNCANDNNPDTPRFISNIRPAYASAGE